MRRINWWARHATLAEVAGALVLVLGWAVLLALMALASGGTR